jgi:hypothetical protein
MGKLKNILRKDVLNELDIDILLDIPQFRGVKYLKPEDKEYIKDNQVLITIQGKNRVYSRIKNFVESSPLIEKIEINGIVSTEDKNFDTDKFVNELCTFFESKKVYFGGGFKDI